MWSLRDIPIHRKLLVIILLTSGLALLLSGVAIVVTDTVLYRRLIQTDLDTLAQIVADNSTAALAFENPQDAAETLASLRARPSLVQACIYRLDSTVFARYARPEAPPECPPPTGTDSERISGNDLLLSRSILLSGGKVGSLYFQYELDEIAARQKRYAALVGAIALVSMILALIFSSRLRLLITQPIIALAGSAKTVSEVKDYGLRAEKLTGDELGQLVDSFNEMLANIQQRDTELRQARDELELRVRERTEQLRQSEERHRLLVERVEDYAIITLDPDGRITSWNAGAERINGYRADEIMGQHLSYFYPREDREHGIPELALQEAAAKGGFRNEGWRVRKDGKPMWANTVITALRDSEGRLVGFSKITRDLTARKRAEDALERQARELARSNAELEKFAYVASHDLQEPLRMVTTFMQLLASRYEGKLDAEADEYIGFAVDGATRMKQLISDLLTYSRVSTHPEELSPTDCEAVLKEVLQNLDLVVKENGAVVNHDPLPTVAADRSQMVQLFQNLVSNAIKFTADRSPQVHISALHTRTEWIFSISDNGIGISPEHRERIFVIFQRLHDRMAYPGTGIGLALCKKIVERHGGRIWVESHPGEGSTFFFTIPTEAAGAGKEKDFEYIHN